MAKQGYSMWGGRFSASPDEFMQEFGSSIDVVIRLLDVDIEGSIAWAELASSTSPLRFVRIGDRWPAHRCYFPATPCPFAAANAGATRGHARPS